MISGLRKLLLLVLMMTLSLVAVPPGWVELLHCRKPEGNLHFAAPLAGNQVIFLIAGDNDAVRIRLSGEHWEAVRVSPDGLESPLPPVRIYPSAPLASATTVDFKLREDEWSWYADGILRGSMAAPFSPPRVVYWPQRPGVALTESMTYHPVPRASFKTDFMIEPGAPNELYPWVIQTGAWHIHTAQQEAVARPETNQQRAKEAPLTADKSPNFYSLKGGGTAGESIITTGYDFYDNYSLSGSIQLEEGEAGIIFYHRDALPATAPDGTQLPPDPNKADFYALTIRMERPTHGNRDIRLWRQRNGIRKTLARASVPLFNNQWYLPGIKVHGDEIICLLDKWELFRVKEQLPPGGKIGLFANTPIEIRFDDITLTPHTAFDLTDLSGIRHNAISHTGAFYPADHRKDAFVHEPGFLVMPAPIPLSLHAAADNRREQHLILGRLHNKNMLFSTDLIPEGDCIAGIIAGWQGSDKPFFRFESQVLNGSLTCRLLHISPDGNARVLDQYEPPDIWKEANGRLSLMLDATDPGHIRCYCNGLLIHYYENDAPVVGASGLWLAPSSRALFVSPRLAAVRAVVRELVQKNPVYREDSFMRHWASPEGQWISGGTNKLWHKGDFFGDFVIRLPIVQGAELHVAVPEGQEEGTAVVRILKDSLTLSTRLAGAPDPVVLTTPLASPTASKDAKPVTAQFLELNHEGSWLWLKLDGTTVLRQRLNIRFKDFGTRVLAKGMSLTDMAKSKVTRTNVLDEYFNESPHDWLANGGDWQIINRFQCTPSWSHMIGEAPHGLGAFWRKQLFKGDLTLEFYAGTRHGYYDDAGNLNCTVMAHDTTPSSGYTVACTEWDQNLSQNWTTLYRNGKRLAKTNAYLVPRRRKGMYRRILNPLVSQGRPIHGAWFYIKLRKIGNHLEYYFDDELIFEHDDNEMPQEGLIGIWTFVHSMTLAQIKVTFDHISPRPIPVTMLPPDDPTPPPADTTPQLWNSSVNGFPIDALDSRHWVFNDMVSQGTFSVFNTFNAGASALSLRNNLGGGEMKLLTSLPPTPLATTAGWRFRLKRSKHALFNLFYDIGLPDGKGALTSPIHCFHRISGDDFSGGDWMLTGTSDVPPVTVDNDPHGWSTVTVFIPSRLRQASDATSGRAVRLLGFGIEQLDAISNGITGNGPGEAYAISLLRPVFYGKPTLKIADGESCAIRPDWLAAWQDSDDPNAQLTKCPAQDGIINSAIIRLRAGSSSIFSFIEWLDLPPVMPCSLKWDTTRADSILLSHDYPYVDPRLASVTLSLNGTVLPAERDNSESVLFRLPSSQQALDALKSGTLALSLTNNGKKSPLSFKTDLPHRLNAPPVLVKLDGLSPFFFNCEAGLSEPLQPSRDERMTLKYDDPEQKAFLHVRNTAYGQALSTPFSLNLSVAQFPVAQFRYRTDDMAFVSMSFANRHYVRLAQGDSSLALPVRLASNLLFDSQWHSWTGIVSDAFASTPLNINRFIPGGLRLASIGSPDQTGRYASIDLDDYVFGPAVRSPQQLVFTPIFFDLDGVKLVQSAILPGPVTAHETSDAAIDALKWADYPPRTKHSPALPESIPDGVLHVLIRAVDALGNRSPVTDIPFLLDRKPLAVTSAVQASSAPLMNGSLLAITLNNTGGSPWQIDKAVFFVNGNKQQLSPWNSSFVHSQDADFLYLNHPFIFRNLLNKAADGDELALEIDNITDGAGNVSPRFRAPFKVNYAADKTGPAWYNLTFSDSVNFSANWDGVHASALRFSPAQYNGLSVHLQKDVSPYLVHSSYYGSADLTLSVNWNIAKHPCISFRLCTTTERSATSIRLILTTNSDKVFSINLKKPDGAPNELNKSLTFTWNNGQWLRFSFNVRQLLINAGLTPENANNTVFKSVIFRRRGTKHADNLLIDDFFIHGMSPSTTDPLKWIAYDASGINSLEIQALNNDNDSKSPLWSHSFPLNTTADLNLLRSRFKGILWLKCQAKDKPGNLSYPFYLPIFSE